MTSRERDGVLAAARWCLLAFADAGAPRLAPHAFWSDGAGLWLALPVDGAEVRGLRDDPRCALWVPPVDPSGPGVALAGRGRVFGLDDPLALVVHGPVLSTAVLALAARSPGLVLEQARQVASFPPRLPRNRVVVRVAIERLRGIVPPPEGAGMAPPLPPVIPADVRRELSGIQSVVVALHHDGDVVVAPAALGAGFVLDGPEALSPGAEVAVGLVPAAGNELLPDVGAALEGSVERDSALAVAHARWWVRGQEGGGAAGAATGGVVLPD
jgi:hypothetical protein